MNFLLAGRNRIIAISAACVTLFLALAAWWWLRPDYATTDRDPRSILSNEIFIAPVTVDPECERPILRLPPGSRVQVLSIRERVAEIRTADGIYGWLPLYALERKDADRLHQKFLRSRRK